MSKTRDRRNPQYWEGRLFRNAFTYQGRRREVPGWCVKIQWRRQRRTLRLRAAKRSDAAREAMGLYAELLRGGWLALEARRSGPGVVGIEVERESARAALRGIGPRKYVSNLNAGFSRELFAELSMDHKTEFLPLSTEDANEARLRAIDLEAELGRDGWSQVGLSHAREATVAVFWHANPMTCTYTTLLTIPATAGVAAPAGPTGPKGWRVLIIEPDGGVRRALAHWLVRAQGIGKVDTCPLAGEARPGLEWDLILANRDQPSHALRALLSPLPSPPAQVLTHGVFADSDAIFASFSGVSQGYLLRRVAPSMLLAPLLPAFPSGPPRDGPDLDRQVRRYFQAIFETGGGQQTGLQVPEFTVREREILDRLGRGLADKEIAGELGISIWTVHSHLKRIFAKYGVRTRTEAVVRHLQK